MVARSDAGPDGAAALGGLTKQRLVFGDVEVPYLYGLDCTDELPGAILERIDDVDSLLFVVDARVVATAERMVAQLARQVRVDLQVVHVQERRKTLAAVQSILDHSVARGLTRRSAIVAMGGGTMTNIVGLAAALLFRGTRLVLLPTTPVAAFDAAVSIKQGVNLSAGKNLCGTYFAPALIACDLRWLITVPRADLLTGLAEMVKNVLVAAPGLEDKLTAAIDALSDHRYEGLSRLLEIGIGAKAPYLRADPHERRAALIFEYGHTAGHAIEFASGGTIGHGEAVAWGMLAAAEVARRRHGLSAAGVAAHHRLLSLLDLPDPAYRLAGLDRAAVRAIIQADNKRGYAACGPDEVLMVLLNEVGRPACDAGSAAPPLVAVPTEALLDAIETVRSTR
jgi:3-dehydroquinate synthase/2-deoxy-scyllo-inosose synthase